MGVGFIPNAFGSLMYGFGNLWATVFGNRAQREANSHNAYMATHDQFGHEFQNLIHRTWFDSLIDGLNRLPRPTFAFGTIGLLVFAMRDPVGFGERMQGLALVPDPMWYILFAIIAFYFGARELQYMRDLKVTNSRKEVADVVANMRSIRALEPGLEPQAAVLTNSEYDTELVSEEPMSNAAIMEWNRRNNRN